MLCATSCASAHPCRYRSGAQRADASSGRNRPSQLENPNPTKPESRSRGRPAGCRSPQRQTAPISRVRDRWARISSPREPPNSASADQPSLGKGGSKDPGPWTPSSPIWATLLAWSARARSRVRPSPREWGHERDAEQFPGRWARPARPGPCSSSTTAPTSPASRCRRTGDGLKPRSQWFECQRTDTGSARRLAGESGPLWVVQRGARLAGEAERRPGDFDRLVGPWRTWRATGEGAKRPHRRPILPSPVDPRPRPGPLDARTPTSAGRRRSVTLGSCPAAASGCRPPR